MTMRQPFSFSYHYDVTCDGCKMTMPVEALSMLPPGWQSEAVAYNETLHACLRCDLASLVAEYRRRKLAVRP